MRLKYLRGLGTPAVRAHERTWYKSGFGTRVGAVEQGPLPSSAGTAGVTDDGVAGGVRVMEIDMDERQSTPKSPRRLRWQAIDRQTSGRRDGGRRDGGRRDGEGSRVEVSGSSATLAAASGVLALSLLLGGCSPAWQTVNPWEVNYQGERLQPLAQGQVVDMTAVSIQEMYGEPEPGWTRLGTSLFIEDVDFKDRGLEAFARSIGASRILWHSRSLGWSSYQSTHRVPVTDTSRTTGTVKGPDGRARDVNLTTKTQRWETRTVEGSKEEFSHHAVFMAPAAR